MKNNKHLLIAGFTLIIFLTPFIGIQLCLFNDKLCWFKLLNFGLSLKDFYTIWISLWGVIGIMITIYFNYRRLNNQDIQIIQLEENEQQNRFSKAIELLSSPNESTRIGGCIALYNYALQNSEKKEIVFEIFCSHIRSSTKLALYKVDYEKKPSNEIQFILNLLFKKDKKDAYQFIDYRANLSDSYLVGVDLEDARIVAANLSHVILSHSELTDCNLKACKFKSTDLSSCILNRTRFDFSQFYDCNFGYITDANVFMNFCFIHQSIFRNFNCNEGSEFKGVYLESVSFNGTWLFEANLIGAKFRKCNDILSTKFESCLIAGIDSSSMNEINEYFIEPINKRYCNRQEDITNFEYLLHPFVEANVSRYNRVPVNC